MVSVMKNKEETLVVHDMGKNITEWVTRGIDGSPYSVYQKRILGDEAGG
jgi:hypothetical protein